MNGISHGEHDFLNFLHFYFWTSLTLYLVISIDGIISSGLKIWRVITQFTHTCIYYT